MEKGKIATGFANMVANKGAVAIGFSLTDSLGDKHRFLFINSHLPGIKLKTMDNL